MSESNLAFWSNSLAKQIVHYPITQYGHYYRSFFSPNANWLEGVKVKLSSRDSEVMRAADASLAVYLPIRRVACFYLLKCYGLHETDPFMGIHWAT
jgi:hypothetical protein